MNQQIRIFNFVLAIGLIVSTGMTAFAQSGGDPSSDMAMWPYYLIIAALLFGAAFFLWKRSKGPAAPTQYDYDSRLKTSEDDDPSEAVDMARELEWFRNAKKSGKPERQSDARTSKIDFKKAVASTPTVNPDDLDINSRSFQDKMRKLMYAQLPVNSFIQLTEGRPYNLLPISSDPSLVNAIDQAQEEFEEDEQVRTLAVRILAAFRTRNSVEALTQIALYDLSADLRSKAVNVLADFDHESVFEAILLACADPTRGVRAAAARGLFKLSFDRAEAWKRIISSNDKYRMTHASRAAIEAGIVAKSFDRLLHDDMKIAYEAFVLIALVIKAGEWQTVVDAFTAARDERVKLAILHVISITRDSDALAAIANVDRSGLSEPIIAKIKDTIEHDVAVGV